MVPSDLDNCQNRLLKALSAESFAKLQPYLEPIDLPLKMVLVKPDELTTDIVFIESGLSSIVATSGNGEDQHIEVGHVGLEGFTGIHIVLGTDQTPNRTFMQVAGTGLRIPASRLMDIVGGDRETNLLLRRYAHTYQIQLAQSALANGRYKMHERLARWLLMCQDRLKGDDLPITHEFLALMLGVRRSGVTNEIHILEGLHVIKAERAHVLIRNRGKLEEIAGGCYGVPEREYDRLIGGSAKPAN
jgi:CRP-like cAMP-binding protein